MAAEQSMAQVALEAAKSVITAVKGAGNSVNTARSLQVMPRTGGPA